MTLRGLKEYNRFYGLIWNKREQDLTPGKASYSHSQGESLQLYLELKDLDV